ncbi:MAG: anti-toxin [Magnetococcales bacterium]|nr:anti-toxin [Magnetococcales bacterium]
MNMLPITMDADIEERLRDVAAALRKPIAECLRDAIMNYIDDRLDYLAASKALARNEPTITLDELERRLGLDG